MKDIVLITAYCPDYVREEKLRKLVTQLNKFRDTLDIMVVSHTPIPADIQKKVNFSFYDEKNELLTDWDLINQPWFAPGNGRVIQSGVITGRNTHLAIYRMWILSFSMLKNVGYKKVHVLEYDSEIKNIDDFIDNGKLLDEHNSVYYLDRKLNISDIFFGSVFSIRVDKLPDDLISLNEENIKQEIRNHKSKSPEGMTQEKLHKMGKYVVKDRSAIETNGNKFATSFEEEWFNPWGVPFVDYNDNTFKFIGWNQAKEKGVKYNIIVNDGKMHNMEVPLGWWKMQDLGSWDEVNKIVVIEDDKLRNTFIVDTQEKKELFKKKSFQAL